MSELSRQPFSNTGERQLVVMVQSLRPGEIDPTLVQRSTVCWVANARKALVDQTSTYSINIYIYICIYQSLQEQTFH